MTSIGLTIAASRESSPKIVAKIKPAQMANASIKAVNPKKTCTKRDVWAMLSIGLTIAANKESSLKLVAKIKPA
jgi:predicted ATP-dependent Lon-type protease